MGEARRGLSRREAAQIVHIAWFLGAPATLTLFTLGLRQRFGYELPWAALFLWLGAVLVIRSTGRAPSVGSSSTHRRSPRACTFGRSVALCGAYSGAIVLAIASWVVIESQPLMDMLCFWGVLNFGSAVVELER